jgi:hypothetical protein
MSDFEEHLAFARDIRPWELPGNIRRDCDPHRALLLSLLAVVSFSCGFFSVFLVVPALIAVPLGLAVRRMSEHDLHEMRWGRMDPEGRARTLLAQVWAGGGILFSLFCWVPFAVWFLLRH